MIRMDIARLSLATAALLAISAQPVMAKPGTRSGDSLPRYSQTSSRAVLTYTPSARTPASAASRSSNDFARPSRVFDRPRFNPIIFLPPQVLERLENFFESRGIDNPALCRIFSFSYCDDPDSPG
ncbi:hypothetical protein H0274_02935 [Altererythrobacter sp. CC-YST694]|uniref:hypothetical protein n=1 Tax=Altererythrobacter sp. CC-YST694 TaxID=2755038 RepID=UPI001D01C999|nr:hypothetical protein [Altererythrobacter sp. CC-YST694]MCB5424204.1 hypothetical protein [Altererythrobacter sp. CC-YST694]